MRITKQEEYGLRCILQLAQNNVEGPLTIPEIALREGLSVDYVTKLLILLRRQGLVKSERGVKGGYRLAKPATAISAGEVMRALGWSLFDEELCKHYPGKLVECIHLGGCGIRPIWITVARQIYSVLDRTTLSEMIKQEAEVAYQLTEQFQRLL